jgi:uncharacterized protein YrrD
MQSVQSLLGRPVLETETGQQIGTIREIVINMTHAVVQSMIITEADWFAGQQSLYFVDLFRIGRDAVMVRNRRLVSAVKEEDPGLHPWYVRDLQGKEIVTETGLNLGNLVDILFNRVNGEIREYELSDGIVADLLYGRAMIPLPQAQIIGSERVIVPETTADLLVTR